MTRTFAFIAALLACVTIQAADKDKPSAEEKAKLQATMDYVKAYPPKSIAYLSDGSKRMQMIADKGITILPDGKVIGIDAGEGPPHTIWLFRGAATEAKCEFIDHPEATREAEIYDVLSSVASGAEQYRSLTPLVTKEFLSHLRCTAESALIDSPRSSLMLTNPEYLVTYDSPDYSGTALFLAQYDGVRLDILTARVAPPSVDEAKPKN